MSQTQPPSREFGRRTFLRGAGAVLSLPFLESALPAAAWRGLERAGAAPEQGPARFVSVFFPNGVNQPDWIGRPSVDSNQASASVKAAKSVAPPVSTDGSVPLPPALEPLASLRDKFSVLRGLAHRNARALGDGPGDHARSSACFLTGAHPFKTAGADIRVGVSLDQELARHLRDETLFPSLELGIEGGRQSGNCDSGYSCVYSSTISWRNERTPVLKETRPRLVFERLFSVGSGASTPAQRRARILSRRSLLDYVSDDARRLRKKLGARDRLKLDEYCESLRDVERRLEKLEKMGTPQAAGLAIPAKPSSYREHVQLMFDLIVLAFRLDLTRVVTFMMANEGSNRRFPELDIPEGHHHLSHHRGDEGKIEKIRRINRFQADLLSYFLEKLDAEKSANGTSLLDSTWCLFGSAIGDGNRHNHHDLPIVLAGGGAGRLTPGRDIRYPEDTPLSNLFLEISHQFGLPLERFGDSTGRIASL